MKIPSENYLVISIEKAVQNAVVSLFQEYPEHFYYCSLITDGEAHAPILSAWSLEALKNRLEQEENPDQARLELKWSYADSPYCGYGEKYFDDVDKLFSERPLTGSAMPFYKWDGEYQLRLRAMEKAMSKLDQRGIFGKGQVRNGIVINVEVMPPDYSNTERAFRLNPPEALSEWLQEASEEK